MRADPNDPPQVKRLFVKFHSSLTRFKGDRLRITVRAREYVWIDLRFINEWKEERLQIGEILISPDKVIVPFKKEVELIEPK